MSDNRGVGLQRFHYITMFLLIGAVYVCTCKSTYIKACLWLPSRDQVIKGGNCRQVVLIQRCISITEAVHGAAYSGHYRQDEVVFLCMWSLGQDSLTSCNTPIFHEHC